MKPSKFKACMAALMVAVCLFGAYYGITNVSSVTPPEPGASFNVPYHHEGIHDSLPLQKDKPSVEHECPYEQSELIEVAEFTSDGQQLTTWYIYSFTYDGVAGTWIVNDAGSHITFYGDTYLYTIDNYNVHLGRCLDGDEQSSGKATLCVYPDSLNPFSFMVVTYD